MFWKIAARNVHKNLRSLALNGAGIALTVFLLVFIFSLSRGVETQIVQRNIEFETGGVTVLLDKALIGWSRHAEGDSLYRMIENVLAQHAEVKTVRRRITMNNASFYGGDGAQRIRLEGIAPQELPLLHEMVNLVEGNTDWSAVPNGLLLSDELAEEAALFLGDECAIVLPTADGSVNMQNYVITGIFRNTSQGDKYQTYMAYDQAKALCHTNLPSRLLIDLRGLDAAETVAGALTFVVRSPDIEIKTYKDFMGRARALSGINRNALLGLASFLLFISFVGIWAMIVEQVNERRREVATLLTLGFSQRSVRVIFLLESLYVSLLFLAVGIALALLVIGAIHANEGLYLGRLAAFAFGSATILPVMKGTDLLLTAVITLLYPLVATRLSLFSLK